MHIFILNKKLVFCFTKAQNSSLEQILQEWLHACSTLLPLTIDWEKIFRHLLRRQKLNTQKFLTHMFNFATWPRGEN